MLIKKFLAGPLGTNCYVLMNEVTKDAILIDPAGCPVTLMNCIDREGLKLQAILLTHAHFDHIMGIDEVIERYGEMPVYVHTEDQKMLQNPDINMSIQEATPYAYFEAQEIVDGQILSLIGKEIKVLHTPGHTPGGVCYYIADEDVLISGDTLFEGSVGRSDFPGGSQSQLIRSIREKLLVLPDDTHVYPGHMNTTLIGHEKMYNPFL